MLQRHTCFPRKSGAQTHRYYHTNCMEQENCPLDLGPSSNRAVEVHQSPVQVTAGQSMGGKSIPLLFVTYNWPACVCSRSGRRRKQDPACVSQDSSISTLHTRHLAVPVLPNVETKTLAVKCEITVSCGFPAIKVLTLGPASSRQQLKKCWARESIPSCGAKQYPSTKRQTA